MVTFRADASTPSLYVAVEDENDGGWLAYLLPGAKGVPPSFDLAEALGKYEGSFLFASRSPNLEKGGAATLASAVEGLLGGMRRCLWLLRPDEVSADTTLDFGFDSAGKRLRTSGRIPLGAETGQANLTLEIVSGDAIRAEGDVLELTGTSGSAPIAWSGPGKLGGSPILAATIPCAGAQRGCVQLEQAITSAKLRKGLNWGFQIAIAEESSATGYLTGWYPLAAGQEGEIPLAISIDPTDPFNDSAADRTMFAFLSPDGQPTVLASGYRTNLGWPVTLAPVTTPKDGQEAARLWLHRSPPDAGLNRNFVAGPVGDFVLGVSAPGKSTASPTLLCGLAGTETISFSAGDTLRFSGRTPAFAAGYPYRDASPVLPPIDPQADRLDRRFLTSWASVRARESAGNHYCAQPKGASLYGKPASGDAGVLLFTEPGTTVGEKAFPLLPYALVEAEGGLALPPARYPDVETKVVSVERRHLVAAGSSGLAAGPPGAAPLAQRDGDATAPTTTPAGLVVQVDQATGRYTEVALAQRVTPAPAVEMKLTEPSTPIQAALQTSQLFLVVANGDSLGTLVEGADEDSGGGCFYNTMRIEDWALRANVRNSTTYGDYKNIVIIKGRRGKLSELVAKPDLWTQSQLAIPSGEKGEKAEIAALSRWLQDYIAASSSRSSSYFKAFEELVEDDSWTGVLVLKADIAEVPSELAGMLGGIDTENFNAHHFGFTITKVDPATVSMSGNSATFGLIHYVDPAFDPGPSPPQPVQPASRPWEFRVLTLNVLFENAAVARFESEAQLCLQQLFGEEVSKMSGEEANPYSALMLKGSLQRSGQSPSYALEAMGDSFFHLEGAALEQVELLQAAFSTTARVPQSGGSTQVSARFDLRGFLDFQALRTSAGEPFDLLSFGQQAGESLRGLYFSGLGVTMDFVQEPSGQHHAPSYGFDVSKIAFDQSQSPAREESLARTLSLKVDSLLTGSGTDTPASLGYLDVATPLQLPGVSGDWYGLRLRVDFGTPGTLAGNIGLTSYLLLTWSPAADGAKGDLGLGLLLPGAGPGSNLLRLQSVLELAVGPVGLTRVRGKDQKENFMLVLNEIALKFLGILKLPPSGATAFYLFGSPTGTGPLSWFALYQQEASKQLTEIEA